MARHYYPHIYFEALRPRTRDSVTGAVYDIDGLPGVTSIKEYKRLALAQLLDFIDGWTVNHKGDVVPFTNKKWSGRTLILIRLGKKRFGKKYQRIIDLVNHYKKRINKTKSMQARIRLAMKAAKELGISEEEAKRILKRVRQKKFSI